MLTSKLLRFSRSFLPTSTSRLAQFSIGLPRASTDLEHHRPYEREPEAVQPDLLKKYKPSELQSSADMLARIIEDQKSQGVEAKVKTDSENALEAIENLIKEGVQPAFIIEGCVKSPKLFEELINHPTESWEVLDSLVSNAGFTFEDAMRTFSDYSEIFFHVGPQKIEAVCNLLSHLRIESGDEMVYIIHDHPEILYQGDIVKMKHIGEQLANFFPMKKRKKLLLQSPQILLQPFEVVEEKYEYIYFYMAMDPYEVLSSTKWFEMSIEDIMMRHQFLEKCGRYKMPDEKRPQLKMSNPSLCKILDTNDEEFAKRVATVTIEEWNVYKSLNEKLKRIGEEKTRPFERIQRRHMKEFARRKKEAEEPQDFVFDNESGVVDDVKKRPL